MHSKILKRLLTGLLLTSLLLVGACASGPTPAATGGSSDRDNFGWSSDQDPEFWTLWANAHGAG